MNLLLNHKDKLIALSIPLLLIATLVVFVKSSAFSSEFANYVIIDFLITIPFFYYLGVRKTTISNKTVFTLIVVGIFIASAILPTQNQGVLPTVKMILLPVIELLIFGYMIFKSVKVYRQFKVEGNSSLDFYDTLLAVCNSVFSPKLGHIVATEFSMIYYSLFNWKKRTLAKNEFSYHKNGTAVSVLLGFMLVVLVEAFVTHAMMKSGNIKGSIILAILSAYTFLQVVSVMRSLSKRPIFIDEKNKELVLRFGLLSMAKIPFEFINNVEISTKELPEKTSIKPFSPLGNMADHNVLIYLSKEIKYPVFYGFTRKAKDLALFVDEKEKFVEILQKIENN